MTAESEAGSGKTRNGPAITRSPDRSVSRVETSGSFRNVSQVLILVCQVSLTIRISDRQFDQESIVQFLPERFLRLLVPIPL